MKKRFIALLSAVIFTSVLTMAQTKESKYCLSYEDYISDTWHTVANLQFEYRSGNKALWWGGSNYKPITGDKKLDNILKKQARFIWHNDSLYLNLRGIAAKRVRFGNWYSPAMVYDKDYFLFIALSTKAINNTSSMALMFGVVGGAISASNSSSDYQCYILYPTSEEMAVPVDETFMLQLLENHPEEAEIYKLLDKKKRYSPETVLPILRKLGLIDN